MVINHDLYWFPFQNETKENQEADKKTNFKVDLVHYFKTDMLNFVHVIQ